MLVLLEGSKAEVGTCIWYSVVVTKAQVQPADVVGSNIEITGSKYKQSVHSA